MRNNLIFAKIPEEENENPTKTIVRNFMVEQLKMTKEVVAEISFERVHRMGIKAFSAYNRNIVAKFSMHKDRESVKKYRSNLRGTQYAVFEQFPREISERRKSLVPKMKEAKSRNQQAWISYGTLYIDGKPVRNNSD